MSDSGDKCSGDKAVGGTGDYQLDSRQRLQWEILNSLGIISQLQAERARQLLVDALPVPLFAILNHFIRLGDGKTVTDLARAFQVPQPGMTKSVQKLIGQGCLRMQPDPVDSRRKILFITDAGKAAHRHTLSRLAPDAERVFADWTEAEMAELQQPLHRLRRWLDENRGALGRPEDGVSQ